MPLSRKIKAYLKTRLFRIKIITSMPIELVDQEDYHKLRVEIKKLKAVLQLLQFYSKNFKRKQYLKAINSVFKSAGMIRESQLENDFLLNLTKKLQPNSLIANNEQLIAETIPLYQNLIKKKSFKSALKPIQLEKKLKKIRKSKLNKYIELQKDELMAILIKENLNSNEIHLIRKYLKNLHYLEEMTDLKINQLSDLDKIQEEIGKWHDALVMSQKFKAHLINGPISKLDSKKLTTIYTRLDKGNEKMLIEIQDHFSDIKKGMNVHS